MVSYFLESLRLYKRVHAAHYLSRLAMSIRYFLQISRYLEFGYDIVFLSSFQPTLGRAGSFGEGFSGSPIFIIMLLYFAIVNNMLEIT